MATETTRTSATAWSPDVVTVPADDVLPGALLLQTSTVVGFVDGDEPAVRVPYVQDDDAAEVPEGTPIPEGDIGLDECVVSTVKYGQLLRLSREQFYTEETGSRVAASVARAVQRAADDGYLNRPAPSADGYGPTGLLNIDGTTTGGQVADSLDALVDLLATLESAGGTPGQIVLDPLGWSELRKLKTGEGAATTLLGAGTTDAVPMLLGLPVVVSTSVPQGTGLVVDRTAVVSAVGPVQVANSEHAAFEADSVLSRATWRVGWSIVRPERVGVFTVASGS